MEIKHTPVSKWLSSMMLSALLPLGVVLMNSCGGSADKAEEVDVIIIGGGASGTAAGVQASRMGASTVIVEETEWLGGMLTGAGVSAVDGNYRMPAGIFGEFRSLLEDYYGGADSLKTGWVSNVLFEPSVGDKMFKKLADAESNLKVFFNATAGDIEYKDNAWMVKVKSLDGSETSYKAKVLIDGTELGDVAKQVGVGYDLGMESRSVTGEDIAPEEAVNIVQDLTMVAVLKEYDHDVTMPEPADYDPDEFACTCINDLCVSPLEPNRMWERDRMITYGKLPNGKYMINWPVEGNDYYINIIEMTPEERAEAIAEAKEHTLRYVYFLQKELGFNNLGLADDEFPTDDLLPFIPYHRESRRIHGLVRFDLNHIMTPYDTQDPLYRTTIAVGDYPVDHHHKAYHGAEELPNLYFHPVPSYGLPMGTLIPRDVDNMLVTEKSISVSNIVNGTTRLQPVVTQLGQAAGAIAALAALNDVPIKDVDVREVQNVILDAGGYLLPYLDVNKHDARFKPYQRIGAAGVLRGEGMSIDWSNETWLHADKPMLESDLIDLYTLYNIEAEELSATEELTLDDVEMLMAELSGVECDGAAILAEYGVEKSGADKLTRGEYALIVDRVLNPFATKKVDIKGNFTE